jgi:SP family general alpha glucoside:H+ symporter-like MFS transporter
MESYDVFLINNFMALGAFQAKYGVPHTVIKNGQQVVEYVIVPKWQSALQVSGQLGALIGVFLAGPLTSRIGYRWATITGLMLLNVFIFAFYFAESMPVFFVAQLLEGLPWGIFIANAPAYCSEIVPIKLRAPATQMLQMFWAIGSIIVGAVCYVYHPRTDPSAYKYVLIRITSKFYADEKKPGFPLRFNGCSPPRSPSSCILHPSRPGGWFERDVSKPQQNRSSALDASRG